MKKSILAIMMLVMLRVFWDVPVGNWSGGTKEDNGIVVGTSSTNVLLVRTEDGKMTWIQLSQVKHSHWEDVKS